MLNIKRVDRVPTTSCNWTNTVSLVIRARSHQLTFLKHHTMLAYINELVREYSEFAICHVVQHGNVNGRRIQKSSIVG